MTREINLYSPSLRQVRDRLTLPALLAAMAASLLLIGGGHLIARARLADAQEALAASETAIQATRQKMIADSQALRGREPDAALTDSLARQEALLQRTRRAAGQIEAALADQQQPFAEVLRALARRHLDGVWLAGLEIGRGARLVRLDGRAVHEALIPDYLAGLHKEPALSGLSFATLQVDGRSPPAAAAVAAVPAADGAAPARPAPRRFVLGDAPPNTQPNTPPNTRPAAPAGEAPR